jgi:hypothetical protein
VCFVLLFCIQFASAQSALDINVGFGTQTNKSTNQLVNTFGDGTLYETPKLGGFFLGFGGRVMLWDKAGVGMEVNFQPNKPDYAGLQARNTFFDVHGIYQPLSNDKMGLQLLGGIGLANIKFYYSSQYCDVFTGCQNINQALASSNHFQLHGGIGWQIYVKGNWFIRPTLDVRYVPNFFQYGRNSVIGGTVWLGYSLGDRP